jgi:hypothetical protein
VSPLLISLAHLSAGVTSRHTSVAAPQNVSEMLWSNYQCFSVYCSFPTASCGGTHGISRMIRLYSKAGSTSTPAFSLIGARNTPKDAIHLFRVTRPRQAAFGFRGYPILRIFQSRGKEYLPASPTGTRPAETKDTISRFHVSIIPAHTVAYCSSLSGCYTMMKTSPRTALRTSLSPTMLRSTGRTMHGLKNVWKIGQAVFPNSDLLDEDPFPMKLELVGRLTYPASKFGHQELFETWMVATSLAVLKYVSTGRLTRIMKDLSTNCIILRTRQR